MSNKLFIYAQYLLPQHLLTRIVGCFADNKTPWFKNFIIKKFIRHYDVTMSDALIENPEAYKSFNEFFIRKLKPHLRPIANSTVVSPVDATISQIGYIKDQELFQAKGFYFDLTSLVGGDSQLANTFKDGAYTTLYLAPRDYHRIHMPLDGRLIKTIYIPGNLFSVNRHTAEHIPQLYSRNERLVCLFETKLGKVAVILVGAMIVGSIQLSFENQPSTHSDNPSNTILLKKGDELGYFKLGSTVILLFEKDSMHWDKSLTADMPIKMGISLEA